MAKRTWSDLSTTQKRAVVVGGTLEAAMTLAALRDLASRRSDEVRGPKAAWMLSFVVQPLGPIAYFAAGRR
ncbi:PLD nuclease N-terminal domain-containing protein [Nocardioides panacis]|uniref:PLD nuclease N-terminal domain-containing protein n=1 Tax=Nocardioides panacis TaxID=2849501 RepID=A0A975Y1W2_9ACTN|nr:PLD nuclease N-terminal domain-containing protein [Nocardioides panacis]QWZ09920.1 PLD nuclease N-terminal domain-containing protein [Nocardioides panacis]